MPRGDGIKPLGSLFEKYKQTLVAPEASVLEAFVEVVKEVLDIEVPKKYIKFSTYDKTLVVTGGGPIKTELLLHKEEILAHLKGRLGVKSAPKNII